MKLWRAACVSLAALGSSPAWAGDDLISAAEAGDVARLSALLGEGADVNQPAGDGGTALLYAAYAGHEEAVAALLAAGADPDIANEYGFLPLMAAATTGDAAVVRRLLEGGADVEAANPVGQTAFMAAARSGHVDTARLLADAGADVNAREGWGGQTALMWAAAEHQVDMVAYLIEAGADLDAQAPARNWDRYNTSEPRIKEMHAAGLTPLLYASREGCLECVELLVEAGADIELYSPERISPLNIALINMRFDVAKYLIEAGADVQKWDFWGRSPLYNAIDFNERPTGMRPDMPRADRTTGLEIAAMLLERGAEVNFRLKLDPPLRNVVFDRGADTAVLAAGATPLMRAARSANADAIRLLLAAGADPNLPAYNGATPLIAAASINPTATRGQFKTEAQAIEATRLLIEAGADVNAGQEASGSSARGAARFGADTAWQGANRMGWTSLVALLEENGAVPAPPEATEGASAGE